MPSRGQGAEETALWRSEGARTRTRRGGHVAAPRDVDAAGAAGRPPGARATKIDVPGGSFFFARRARVTPIDARHGHRRDRLRRPRLRPPREGASNDVLGRISPSRARPLAAVEVRGRTHPNAPDRRAARPGRVRHPHRHRASAPSVGDVRGVARAREAQRVARGRVGRAGSRGARAAGRASHRRRGETARLGRAREPHPSLPKTKRRGVDGGDARARTRRERGRGLDRVAGEGPRDRDALGEVREGARRRAGVSRGQERSGRRARGLRARRAGENIAPKRENVAVAERSRNAVAGETRGTEVALIFTRVARASRCVERRDARWSRITVEARPRGRPLARRPRSAGGPHTPQISSLLSALLHARAESCDRVNEGMSSRTTGAQNASGQ